MDVADKINAIRLELVDPNKVDRAFQKLNDLLVQQYPHLVSSLLTFQAAFEKNEQENLEGLIAAEAYRIEFRRIIKGVSVLLDKVLEEEKKRTGSFISRGSDLSIVSCNRKAIMKRFSISFEQKEGLNIPARFYLLIGQKFGQANSIVKRLISILKEEKTSVKYSGFNQIYIPDIDIAPGDNVKDGRHFFKKAFNKGIKPQVKSLAAFAAGIDRYYPAYQNVRYIPFAFSINFLEESWSVVKKLITWLTKEFSALEKVDDRVFIFFIIVNLTDRRRNKRESWFGFGKRRKSFADKLLPMLEPLESLETGVTVLPPLARVAYEDLDDWYKAYESNEALRVRKLEEIIRNLGGEGPWDMSYVELELEKVVREYQNKRFGL